MAKPLRINPDLQFVKNLQAVGGEDLKKCYQCATCSVVCPLSPGDDPYPRKEMIWAQWGLKDKLLKDIDIWLCHNCGTCSDLCPRGAKPGDLLAALRNMTYRELVSPKIIGKWMSASKYLPVLVAIPAILFLIIWIIRAGQLGSAFPLYHGHVKYGHLFPGDFTIDPIFTSLTIIVVLIFIGGIKRLIDGFRAGDTTFRVAFKRPTLAQAVWSVVAEQILPHKRWQQCGETQSDRDRLWGHLILFFAFVVLAVVTGTIAMSHWGGRVIHIKLLEFFGHTPLALWNPLKVLANVGALMLLTGLAILTKRRVNLNPDKSTSSFYDWYLLGVIWVIAVSGILSEIFRLANVRYLAYPSYYVHLIAVFMLIGYLPWSKLGHMVYRTAALIYARYTGRAPMGEEEIKEENVLVI